MPIINKGTAFSNGEQLTADKINNLLDLATFNQSATDSASTTVNSASQIVVADSGITTAKLATDAVETAKIKDANVTKAKIEDVADYKVLGNVSGATAAPAEVSILDEDDMTSDSATALATQQSIKAYVDSNGITTTTGTAPYYGCRAFASYNGSTQVLNNGANITSVTRNSTANYTFNFDVDMPDVDYSIVVGGTFSGVLNTAYIAAFQTYSKTTSSFTIKASGGGPSGGDTDQTVVDVAVFR